MHIFVRCVGEKVRAGVLVKGKRQPNQLYSCGKARILERVETGKRDFRFTPLWSESVVVGREFMTFDSK